MLKQTARQMQENGSDFEVAVHHAGRLGGSSEVCHIHLVTKQINVGAQVAFPHLCSLGPQPIERTIHLLRGGWGHPTSVILTDMWRVSRATLDLVKIMVNINYHRCHLHVADSDCS